MLQPLIMACFLAIFLREALGAPLLSRWMPAPAGAGLALAMFAGVAICTHAVLWALTRRIDRTGDARLVRRADLAVGTAWLAAGAVHGAAVLALGWLDAVRQVVGDVVILDEAVAMAPLVGVIVSCWWSMYPLDRRVRDATVIRELDEARPVYGGPTRGGFVSMAVRHHLAIILVPILLIMAWSEMVEWGARRWSDSANGSVMLAVLIAQIAGTVCVFTAMPPIMRRVWDTVPLAPGPMRSRLDELCRRHGVRNRELLVWRTHGTMINGAVLGLLAPVRYIMLTDALLEQLGERQVEAVMAHEVGHIRRRHLPWLIVSMMGAMGLVVGMADLAVWLAAPPGWLIALAEIPVTIGAFAGAVLVFGFVSRRFEWQADAFAVQHLSGPGAREDGSSGGEVTADAVRAMSGALQSVASLNHVPPDRFSWRHGSIRTRQRRLAAMVGLPVDGLPIDRTARRVKAMAAVCLLAAAVLISAPRLWPGTMWP